jgi:YggT family protein
MADFILLLHILRIPIQIGIAIALVVVAPLAAVCWAERTRRLNPFGAPARMARSICDPLLRPLDRIVARFGAARSNTPWWGLLAVLLFGALLLGVLDFVRDTLSYAYYATHQGPYSVLRLAVGWAFSILQLALMARVIMSWVGGYYSRVGRIAHALTEWFLGPLRRALPTIGVVDISPIVAWFLLSVTRTLVLSAIGN